MLVTKRKILLICLLLVITTFSGCIDENNSKTQTQVVTNGTAVMDMSADLSLQAGERIHYEAECTFCPDEDKLGNKIAKFSETHNVTRIKMNTNTNNYIIGAYIIYRN